MTVYGYARVSTVDQSLALQIEALVKAGVPVENIFSEKLSGKNTKQRPEWSRLEGTEKLKDGQKMDGILQAGDVLYVTKLDRLGRSVSDVTRIVEKFQENGIFLVVTDQGIDTRKIGSGMEGMMTKALMVLLSLMAEMERTFIMERTRPAIEQAKKNGVKFGKPFGKVDLYNKAVEEYLAEGNTKSIPEILKSYGTEFKDGKPKDILTEATFYRRLKKRKAELGLS